LTGVRIARPILLVTTPLGVIFGLREAWRLAGPGMAVLMAVMLTVVGALVWWTVRRIQQEQKGDRGSGIGDRG
jgi:prepilin signal peptidase PulO-like enzyme (type II secretory pathway)